MFVLIEGHFTMPAYLTLLISIDLRCPHEITSASFFLSTLIEDVLTVSHSHLVTVTYDAVVSHLLNQLITFVIAGSASNLIVAGRKRLHND